MSDPKKQILGVLKLRKPHCTECKKLFQPNARLGHRQKTCTQINCQLKYRARYRKAYRQKNPAFENEYREKIRSARSADFWKDYRKNHFQSTKTNRLKSKLRKRLWQAGLQRQLDIAQVAEPPGYFSLFCEFAMSHRSLIADCTAKDAA